MRAPTRAATPRSGKTPVTSARHRSHSPGGAGAEVSGQLRRPHAARARTKHSSVPEYRRSARIWAAPERVRRGGIPEGHGGAGGLLILVGAFIILPAMPPRLVTALEIRCRARADGNPVDAPHACRRVPAPTPRENVAWGTIARGAFAKRRSRRVPNWREGAESSATRGSRKEPEPGGGPLPGRHA